VTEHDAGPFPNDFARQVGHYLVELQRLDPLSRYRRFPDVLRVFMSRRPGRERQGSGFRLER
jgi:hypothetical protein